uniref:Uncharacterized protein n=1 Tax=Anguilla anguilla TaxID=7936 RepID=A0A0E9UN90_ANGAN
MQKHKVKSFRLGDAPETSGVPWVTTANLQIRWKARFLS